MHCHVEHRFTWRRSLPRKVLGLAEQKWKSIETTFVPSYTNLSVNPVSLTSVTSKWLCSRFPFQVWSSGFHRITGLMLNGSTSIDLRDSSYSVYFSPRCSVVHCWSFGYLSHWSQCWNLGLYLSYEYSQLVHPISEDLHGLAVSSNQFQSITSIASLPRIAYHTLNGIRHLVRDSEDHWWRRRSSIAVLGLGCRQRFLWIWKDQCIGLRTFICSGYWYRPSLKTLIQSSYVLNRISHWRSSSFPIFFCQSLEL